MGTDLEATYQLMMQRLKDFMKKRIDLKEIITFCEKVLEAQAAVQPRISLPTLKLDHERMRVKIREGFPLFQREDFPVDQERSAELLGKLCRLGLDENPLLAEAGRRLLEAIDSTRVQLNDLFSVVVKDNDAGLEPLAAELKVGRPVLKALVKLSIQPSLWALVAAATNDMSLEGWQHPYCPVCGSMPAMAALVGDEGRRHGLCSFCGHLYRLPRVGCPFCGSESQEDFRYFYGEDEDPYRVQVCDRCTGYLKILDTRKEGSLAALAVEDILTAHLDLVAEEEGFERKTPRLWGI